MSDFNAIEKRLDYGPVVQDTTLVTKPLSWDGVRDIKKIRQQIVIPAYTFDSYNINYNFIKRPIIVYQYNYTVPQSFRISNQNEIQTKIELSLDSFTGGNNYFSIPGTIVCLRYRTGNIITRIYLGAGGKQEIETEVPTLQTFIRNILMFDNLDNQKIPCNFVVEIWFYSIMLQDIPILADNYRFKGLKVPVLINTSITRNPVDADDNSPDLIYPISTIDYIGLSSNKDEVLPIAVNSNGPWISN
jgi:hypothetical protein